MSSSSRFATRLLSRSFPPVLTRQTITRPVIYHEQLHQQQHRKLTKMADTPTIETTTVNTAPSISLSDRQSLLVRSVFDLFKGKPSLAKLQLWKDDATFEDPIAKAHGRKEFEAQWYGLQAAFSDIKPLSHEVISAGNPIEIKMSTQYTVKGLGKATTIDSLVRVFYDEQVGKISKVEDKWNGNLPDSAFTNAFRRLNAVTMPNVVGVPKNAEEDAKRGN